MKYCASICFNLQRGLQTSTVLYLFQSSNPNSHSLPFRPPLTGVVQKQNMSGYSLLIHPQMFPMSLTYHSKSTPVSPPPLRQPRNTMRLFHLRDQPPVFFALFFPTKVYITQKLTLT